MYFNEKKQELAPFVNLRSDVGFKAVFADKQQGHPNRDAEHDPTLRGQNR